MVIWGVIFTHVNLPIIRSFKIKHLVLRSSNLRDLLLGENDSGLNSRLKSFTKRENFGFLKYSK